MKIGFGKIASAAGAAGLAAMVLAGPAAAATPRLDTCQKAIEGAAIKLEASGVKALQYCKDQYRAQAVKGVSGAALAATAAKCQIKLNLAFQFPDAGGKSAAQKAYTALSGLVAGGKCDNTMLQQLGHLRQDTNPPDVWARIAVARGIRGAIEQQIGNVRDVINVFQDLYQSDGGVSCPNCGDYVLGGPCAIHACCLGGASSTCVDTATLDIPLSLSGVEAIGICDMPNVLAGAYIVLGTPSKGLAPVPLGGGTVACVNALGAEGYINRCTGPSQPTLNTSICQDHVVGAPDTNECPGAPAACGPDKPSTDYALNTNGGACLAVTTSAAAAGGASIINENQITVLFAGQEGGDGVPCTSDDTPTLPGVPAGTPLTTGIATATVLDRDTVNGAVLPNGPTCPNPATVTGADFDCTQIEASILAGGKFVGSFPALEALFGPPRVDSVTTFTLECN
jgi:hypothetical protein